MLYFAAVRELVGVAREAWELPARASDVAALRARLEERHDALAGRLSAVRFAVNEELVALDRELSDGDVVAIIPPVAGGAGRLPASERVDVRDERLAIDSVLRLVRHDGAGALSVFMGVVRDHNDGAAVDALEYTAYASMAKGEMASIVEEIERELPEVRLAAHHRIGALAVGDDAVICAASAPHREEAFVAARRLIDRIKERAPIWKRERGPDRDAWIGWDAS